jgi:CubicO group peptidase (beta-lactamase class C family)
MSGRPFLSLLACGLAACGSSARVDAPPATAPDPAADSLRQTLAPLYEEGILQGGMVIGLVDPTRKDGVTYLRFGRTSPEIAEAPGPEAIFEIGSVSKVLTGLLLADAAGKGEVSLDTEVAKLLPFGVRFPDKDGARPTLAHLASHRSGLPTLPDNLAPESLLDPYATFGPRQLYAYLERAELLFVPGEHYAYSNLGAGLLGHLLERRLGVAYEQAVKTRVLAPLGLAETWIAVPEAEARRVVPGTTAGGEPTPAWTFDVLAGAGAWRSTPRDMAKLVQAAAAAAAGGQAVFADTLRTSFQPLGDAAEDGDGMKIALAWHVTGEGVVWHNGMTGGHSSFVGFDPATSKGVVVLASTASPLITRIGIGTFDVLAGKPLDLGLGFVAVAEADLEPLAGTYRLGDGQTLAIERQGTRLFLTMGSEKVRLFPRSKTQFVILELESSLEFAVEDGRVLGFVLHLQQGDVVAERVAQ